jgi:predicted TIM-barrel fold metal-dependent hydrolase
VIIDFHTHVYPPKQAAAPRWQGRCPMTIENVLAAQERHGVDISVISNHTPYMRHSEPEPILAEHREINKFLAEQQHKHSGKIYALACSVPNGRDDYLKELERAVKVDGMKGVMIRASHQHAYPDDDEAKPFFKLCCDLDVPVVMHPPPVGFGEERMKDYRLASSVGRPADNCLALARLIVRGIFEEFPNLKLVATHLGGGICEVIGRMNYAYTMQEEAFFLGSYEPMLIRHEPLHYLKMCYLDTVCYHLPAARCVVESVGADRVIFGTDAPPLTAIKGKGLQMIYDLGLAPLDQEKILSGNARQLLKLG